jgi:hypothetical protein
MTATRPDFDEAIAHWRELLRARGLPARLTWIFSEDIHAVTSGDALQFGLRPRSSAAGEWLARLAYRSASAADTLVFAAYADANGCTVTGLRNAHPDADRSERREGWDVLFDATCHLRNPFSSIDARDGTPTAAALPGLDHPIPLRPLRERMTADDRKQLRHEALRDLVLFTSPMHSIGHSLGDLERAADKIAMLEKQHVLSILRRYDADEIAGPDIKAWANAIETRGDVGYDRETAVWDVLYELANPDVTEPLTKSRADILISVLQGY